jgi:hypothetical protein
MIELFNFVHFSYAMLDNNTDPGIIMWWLKWRKKRGRENKTLGASILPGHCELRFLLFQKNLTRIQTPSSHEKFFPKPNIFCPT